MKHLNWLRHVPLWVLIIVSIMEPRNPDSGNFADEMRNYQAGLTALAVYLAVVPQNLFTRLALQWIYKEIALCDTVLSLGVVTAGTAR